MARVARVARRVGVATCGGGAGSGATGGDVGSAQPSVMPRIAASTLPRRQLVGKNRLPRRQRVSIDRPRSGQPLGMWIIVLEMLAALAVLLFIVWWTMFAGRRRGERRDDHDAQ